RPRRTRPTATATPRHERDAGTAERGAIAARSMSTALKTTEKDAPVPANSPARAEAAISQAKALPRRRRRTLRLTLLLLGPLILLVAGSYFYVTSARYVSTDNAAVKADI